MCVENSINEFFKESFKGRCMYLKHGKTLQGISLIFENCESVYIPINDVEFFNIEGITEQFSLCDENKSCYTKSCVICTLFLKNYIDVYNDITHIKIHFLNEHPEYIAVPWKGAFTNHWQVVTYNTDVCHIHISLHWNVRKIVNYFLRIWNSAWFFIRRYP